MSQPCEVAGLEGMRRERQRLLDQIDYHERRYQTLGEWMDHSKAHDLKRQLFDIDEEIRRSSR